MKTWKIKKHIKATDVKKRRLEIINTLLVNRNISPTQKNRFLNPSHPKTLTPKAVGIDQKQLRAAIKLIKQFIKQQTPIIVYGDYDADGICATAILWETLHKLNAQATPFIPHRFKHGYGVSKKGIDQIVKDQKLSADSSALLITVDNGIVANSAIKYARSLGFKVIVTDHHVKGKALPAADAIVHTTSLAGVGVSWFLSKTLWSSLRSSDHPSSHLELAAIGTIADMVPLIDANRSIAHFGLKALTLTKRLGLNKLFNLSTIDKNNISTYQVNFIIAPRINAMGRLGYALDSLRLLCTTNKKRASDLAYKLNDTNLKRQTLTQTQLEKAQTLAKTQLKNQKILIIKHKSFHEGVIGLIAGRLSESHYLPSVVISQGKSFSKASARSISGFNLIASLRKLESFLVDVGGHPMAAGFTIKNSQIKVFTKKLQQLAQKTITKAKLKKRISIDCLINTKDINQTLHDQIQTFAPFGIKNPQPLFAIKESLVSQARAVGQDKRHLKLVIEKNISCIGFGLGKHAEKLSTGSRVNLAFQIDQNHWNNKTSLQLKLKDIKVDNLESR